MNKQEVIEKLREHGAWCTECHDINGKKDRYVKAAKVRELLDQLDEPQKVKVKQFVADWFEEHKDDLEFSIWKLTIESNDNYTSDRSKMRNWIQYAPNKPYETLLSMKNGYEVEEEPKYIVPVPNLSKEFFYTADGERISFCQRRNIDDVKSKVKFTLKEVKRLFPELVDTVEKAEE